MDFNDHKSGLLKMTSGHCQGWRKQIFLVMQILGVDDLKGGTQIEVIDHIIILL